MKFCVCCDIKKPMNEFYKSKSSSDGRINRCKECTKKDVRANRLKNIDRYRAYDRKRGPRQSPEYLKKYRETNKIKYAAHCLVNNAIRDNRLEKRSSCEKCGKSKNIHAHHDDYTKPLDVRWLCPPCHFKWHKKNGSGKT